ncbi:MAG: glycosyltransferase [Patescibacteria group bacterium]
MKYTFVIPVKEINDYIRETIPNILEIKRDDFEIIIYPNEINSEHWPKTKQISTGPGGPAMKRNLAIRDAKGEILIFVDDDAFPKNNLLEILDQDFNDKNIIAVGGPALTPKEDNFWQKVSGAVFLSNFSGGFPERYVQVGQKRFINDWPSVNLSIRKNNFQKVKGFNSEYWPGEDTKLCIDLLKENKGKIIYDPELIVYHHRRQGLLEHLKQVGNYGIHRGFFAKKYPETSLKLKYFVPSFFLLFIILGAISSIFSSIILRLYILGWIIYALSYIKIFFDIHKYEKNILIIFNTFYYIFLTHIWYGTRFLQGFIFTKNLKSKYR